MKTNFEGFNKLVQSVNQRSSTYKLALNGSKTTILAIDKWQENTNIVIDNIHITYTLDEYRVSNIWAQCIPQMEMGLVRRKHT